MSRHASVVELWIDDHQEYEPGIVTGHLRHARIPLDPHRGDFLVVGDEEVSPALAEVVSRETDGTVRRGYCPADRTVTASSLLDAVGRRDDPVPSIH